MSTPLQHARQQIDDIDRRLVALLAERQAVVDDVAEWKAATDHRVRDPDREEKLLSRVRDLAERARLAPDLVEKLYEQILAHSVQRQLRQRRQAREEHRRDAATGDGMGTEADAALPPAPPTPSPSSSRVDRPYHLAARSHRPHDTVVTVGELEIGGPAPTLIAGPCSVESRDQIMTCAEAVARAGGHLLRGGCFKPRTSPYSFQGLGREGLDLLAEAGRAFGLPVITEVLHPADVSAVAAKADVLQIGARNMQNFALLKAVGAAKRPVMLKRGMMASIDEWLAAAEYILAHGNDRVFLCERGIRTFETATRNTLDISAVPVLRERTHLPVIVDPAHACGERRWIQPLVQAAVAAGAHGVMVEVHPNPDEALSDGPQSLPLDALGDIARAVHEEHEWSR